jgi:hypothetical protein
MKRLLGFQSPYSPEVTSLLGIDPREMRQQALWNGLANAGFALMGSNNLGDVGQAALAGINQGRDQYMDEALLGYRLNQDAQEAERRRQEEADQAAALEMFPPEMQPIVKAYPQIGQEYLQRQYLPDPEPVNAPQAQSYAPIMYRDRNGNVRYGIPMSDGSFREVQSPDGAQFFGPQEKAFETSAGAASGKITTEQRLSAPADISAADQALDLLRQIRENPYREQGTGFTSYGNILRGSGGYDFQNLVEQAKSGAFLTAIDQLKGMGALSNMEGQAATAAVTRMDTATSEEAFMNAVNDYEKIVIAARQRAIQRGGGAVPPPPGGGGGAPDPLGIR